MERALSGAFAGGRLCRSALAQALWGCGGAPGLLHFADHCHPARVPVGQPALREPTLPPCRLSEQSVTWVSDLLAGSPSQRQSEMKRPAGAHGEAPGGAAGRPGTEFTAPVVCQVQSCERGPGGGNTTSPPSPRRPETVYQPCLPRNWGLAPGEGRWACSGPPVPAEADVPRAAAPPWPQLPPWPRAGARPHK